MRRAPRIARRGLTLLELLLAITIVASVMGLIGALMGQARAWTERSHTDEVLMRVQRVGEAMRSQWSDRRTSVALDEDGNRVVTNARELRFLTATPMLFPEWPLVQAEYRIEPVVGSGGAPSEPRWRLVYVETRIAGMEEVPGEHTVDAGGRSMRDAIVLLDGCEWLAWERFGRLSEEAEVPDERAAPRDEPGTHRATRPDGTERAEEAARREVERRRQDEREDRADRPTGADGEDAFTWRAMEGTYGGFVPAVRLVGSYEGERFGWVFVVKALR